MRDEVARLAATKAIEIARSAVKQRGATGPKGDRGNDGKDGEPGPQGKPGKDGRDGYDGKDGLPGQNGRNGFDGKNGMPGKDGRDGLNGKDGAKGPKGDKGERGDIGPMGKPGDTGPMPKHQRKGLMIRFESSPGKWGEWIVIPTGGGGGGGRDDKLTDRQKELVEIGDLIRTQGNNSSKFIKTVNGVLQWDTLDGSDLDLSSPPAIGATTPSTGVFTTLGVTTSINASSGSANADLNVNSKGTGAVNLSTGNGIGFRVYDGSGGTPQVNYFQARGRSTGAGPYIVTDGTDTNISSNFGTKGTGSFSFLTSGASLEQMRVSHTASAVNYVQVTGAATGSFPRISTQGSDSAASLAVTAKSGTIWLETASGFGMVGVNHTAGANNYLALTGGANKGPVISAASGSNSNIDLVLSPKGTGALQAQQTDSTATGGNARGANAVDWQMNRTTNTMVASGTYSIIAGGQNNIANNYASAVSGGYSNTNAGFASGIASGTQNILNGSLSFIGGGLGNSVASSAAGNSYAGVVTGYQNTSSGTFNFIGGGTLNTGTSASAVTTQSATMNATTAVTLAASNANIKVGQYVLGTSIQQFPPTHVAAISGTSLTLSQAAIGSSTSTLSFFTPHGVVVGGGNNQATGAYSVILGGGDAGTAANRNVASGDWGTIGGGRKNVASGAGSTVAGGGTNGANTFSNTASGTTSFIGGGWNNTAGGTLSVVVGGTSNSSSGVDSFIGGGDNHIASGLTSAIIGGRQGTTRGLSGYHAFPACYNPIANLSGVSQSGLLVLGRQTTDATATVITSDNNAASTTNQVILPNNSAYYFKVEIIANVTGGGNTSGWELKGVIKRGANAASTAIVGSVTSTLIAQDAGASTWVVSATADTTNGGLKITVTGQASTTIRWVAKASTTEVTF